jgi:hypothetical protein
LAGGKQEVTPGGDSEIKISAGSGTNAAGVASTDGASDDKTAADNQSVSRDVNNSQYEDLFDRRRRWGKNIQIYRLIDGKF